MKVSELFDLVTGKKTIEGECCCCGVPTDLFQFGHFWCLICEGRGHNSPEWAEELSKMDDRSEECTRLWKKYLEGLEREVPK